MGDARSAFTGATTGGALGAGFGPIGLGVGAGVGGLIGLTTDLFGGGEKEAMKKLIAKQEEIARETRLRRFDQQTGRMNALGTQLQAFDPLNKAMAQMYGADAAFTPEQFAQMGQSPMPRPELESKYVDYRGNDPKVQGYIEDTMRKQAQWDAAEAERKRKLLGMSRPQGPAPIDMPQPLAPRGR